MEERFNIYDPIYKRIGNEPMDLTYYELRIWKYHFLIETQKYSTLKQARKYYKRQKLDIEEEKGHLYVEIIKVKPLKKRVIT